MCPIELDPVQLVMAVYPQRKRLSESYSLLTTHELDRDHRTHMSQNHFQNGPDAWDYLTAQVRSGRSSDVTAIIPELHGTLGAVAVGRNMHRRLAPSTRASEVKWLPVEMRSRVSS